MQGNVQMVVRQSLGPVLVCARAAYGLALSLQ
jgi:hypothetical protein